MDAPQPGEIGGTYGGNPLSCAAALAVLDIIEKDKLVERSNKLGELMKIRLEEMQKKYSIIGDVRGKGFMQAVELVKDKETKEPAVEMKSKIIEECLNNGLILVGAGLHSNVIRFLAPISITEAQMEEGLDILEAAVAKFA
jgi:4-aminobutyrate aminotransferase/(S)-3-amino-2-methylpropionate transaminase